MSTYQNFVCSGDEKNVDSPPKMSIDIEDFKWAAENLDHCHSARELALVLFPVMVDELIEAKKRDRQPPAFAIGDRVRIKEPSAYAGCEFYVSETNLAGEYSSAGFPWYPASSLELVEDLQVGDLVEITGPDNDGNLKWRGTKYQITKSLKNGLFAMGGRCWFPASSLRKIPDQTIAEAQAELQTKIDAGTQAIRDLLAPLVDDRLKEIEEESASQHCQTQVLMTAQARTDRRISEIVERLSKIEAALRSI